METRHEKKRKTSSDVFLPSELWTRCWLFSTDNDLICNIAVVCRQWNALSKILIQNCFLTACGEKNIPQMKKHIGKGTAWFTNRQWYENILYNFIAFGNLDMVELFYDHHERIVDVIKKRYISNFIIEEETEYVLYFQNGFHAYDIIDKLVDKLYNKMGYNLFSDVDEIDELDKYLGEEDDFDQIIRMIRFLYQHMHLLPSNKSRTRPLKS